MSVRPLIDHAIGVLGDYSGDLGTLRRALHRMKNKETWTKDELAALKESLINVAEMCHSDYSEWEEVTNVKLP